MDQATTKEKFNISELDKTMKTSLYFNKLLQLNGAHLRSFETIHIMIMYFITYSLKLTHQLTPAQQQKIRQYVLSLEIPTGGWTCSSYYTHYSSQNNPYNIPHIVFTYSAINILSMVGGLDKINQKACLQSVTKCQKPNGSFSSFHNSDEADLRFVYSAVAICHTLNDFSGINKEETVEYIESCFNFDGGYGLRPFCQSHSGAIYCALASLSMLNVTPKQEKRTLNFLVNRQTFNLQAPDYIGVQGRVGKFPDSCYSFWVGASIKIITKKNLLNPKVENYIDLCYKEKQCSFGKFPNSQLGDPVHTAHSIVGIKLCRRIQEQINLVKGSVE